MDESDKTHVKKEKKGHKKREVLVGKTKYVPVTKWKLRS